MTSAVLTDAEKRACTTLSRLFLDTEMAAGELDSIAASLQALNIPTSTLDHVLRNDLFPVLFPNLMSVAGVWSGFDDHWLLNQIESRRMTKPGWTRTLRDSAAWFLVGGTIVPAWNEIKGKLQSKL